MGLRVLATGWRYLWITVLVIVFDRLTKYWAVKYLSLYQPKEIFPSLNFTLAYNTGAAFSFLRDGEAWQHFLLGVIAVLVSLCVVLWMHKLSYKERWLNVTLALILGGALGNLWDRIQYGYVIDFIQLYISRWSWPVFNVADSVICLGMVMLIWHWSRDARK